MVIIPIERSSAPYMSTFVCKCMCVCEYETQWGGVEQVLYAQDCPHVVVLPGVWIMCDHSDELWKSTFVYDQTSSVSSCIRFQVVAEMFHVSPQMFQTLWRSNYQFSGLSWGFRRSACKPTWTWPRTKKKFEHLQHLSFGLLHLMRTHKPRRRFIWSDEVWSTWLQLKLFNEGQNLIKTV